MADTIYGKGGYAGGTSGHDVMVALSPTHLDGGAGSDNLNGSSGADILQGGSGSDYMFGGAGNDTFLFLASDVNQENANNTVVDKIFDFEGAGVAGGDRLTFYGFGEGSSLTMVGTDGQHLSNGSVIYQYTLTDSSTGHHETIYITSVNGAKLTTDDYAFYGSHPVSGVGV